MKKAIIKAITSITLATLAITAVPFAEITTNTNILSVSASAATVYRRVQLTQAEYDSIIRNWNSKGCSYLGWDLNPSAAKKACVKDIQSLLNKIMGTNMIEDGLYGNTSASYCWAFQKANGLAADSLFGNASFQKALSYVDIVSVPTQTSQKLDLNAAISYAKTYWNKLDPNNGFYMSNGTKTYDPAKFSTNGNNCANYVSAILLASGLKTDGTWYRGSYAWINVNSMRNYFTSKRIKYISYPSSSQIDVGDVLYTSSGHVMFVTSAEPVGNGTKIIRATGNTNNRNIDYRITSFYGVIKTSLLF